MITPKDQAILDDQEARAMARPDRPFQLRRRGRKPFDRHALEDANRKLDRHRGIHYHFARMRFQVHLRFSGKQYFIGDFKEQTEALLARDNGKWFLQDFSRYRPTLNFAPPLAILPRIALLRAQLLVNCDGQPPYTHPGLGFVTPRIPKLTMADFDRSPKELRESYALRCEELAHFIQVFDSWKREFFQDASVSQWDGSVFKFQKALFPFCCGSAVPWGLESLEKHLREAGVTVARADDGSTHLQINR